MMTRRLFLKRLGLVAAPAVAAPCLISHNIITRPAIVAPSVFGEGCAVYRTIPLPIIEILRNPMIRHQFGDEEFQRLYGEVVIPRQSIL